MEDVEVHGTDVLVVGAGAAGLRAAIAAQETGADILVVGKRPRGDAHTVLAAGGINAALGTRDAEDSWQQHFADTVRESYFIADPDAVELLAREAPAAVLELAAWRCDFDRTDDGRIDQRFFGAHRYRRTCYAGDRTGREVLGALERRARALDLQVLEGRSIASLLCEDGVCRGALGFDLGSGRPEAFQARAVVLATGGHTRIWRQSTSRFGENTGDGMALALEAGCALADMEFVQFHPTGMVAPEEAAGTLVTEAVRGEGGRLYNAEGERFMERYDPERLELSARDRVALANYTEIAAGRGGPSGGVFLDISHRAAEEIRKKLPGMVRQLAELADLDLTRDPVEVAPTAHYSMGGLVVEPETQATELPGLFAAGEVTAGLHGANRLGGNSLAETVVFGRRAGDAAAAFAHAGDAGGPVAAAARSALDRLAASGRPPGDAAELQRELGEVMWRSCGVRRDRAGLERGLAEVRGLGPPPGVAGGSGQELSDALDLRWSLVTAETTLAAALERRESRGAHQREDHPDTDPALQLRLRVRRADAELVLERAAIPPVPEELQSLLEEEAEVVGTERLLE